MASTTKGMDKNAQAAVSNTKGKACVYSPTGRFGTLKLFKEEWLEDHKIRNGTEMYLLVKWEPQEDTACLHIATLKIMFVEVHQPLRIMAKLVNEDDNKVLGAVVPAVPDEKLEVLLFVKADSAACAAVSVFNHNSTTHEVVLDAKWMDWNHQQVYRCVGKCSTCGDKVKMEESFCPCLKAEFCSVTCQQASWHYHKQTCSFYMCHPGKEPTGCPKLVSTSTQEQSELCKMDATWM